MTKTEELKLKNEAYQIAADYTLKIIKEMRLVGLDDTEAVEKYKQYLSLIE